MPSGIEYEYTWSATKDNVAIDPVTSIGSDNASATETSVFTINTTDPGSYVLNVAVKYKLATANTGVLRPVASCQATTSSTQAVVVNPKPDKPTIQLL